jgi:Rrf2 family protein
MRMSSGVEWSIHCCSMLSFLGPEQALPASKLAEFHGVPAPYLTKHLQSLVQAGVCESVPGPRGGFRLARPAADISLLDVTLAVDGDGHAFVCTEIRQRGPAALDDPSCYATSCGIAQAMWRAEAAWRAELESISIADIAASLGDAVRPEQIALAATWLEVALRERGRKPGGSS